MKRRNTIKIFLVIITTLFIFLLSYGEQTVQAASYTMKAPDTFSSIKLQQENKGYHGGYSGYNPFDNFSLKLEGWACSEYFADITIGKIREINRLIQPLSSAQESLAALEKTLVQAGLENAFTKIQVESAVKRIIVESIKKAGFSSDDLLIENAKSLSKETLEKANLGINAVFNYYWGDGNIFQNYYRGTPGVIWKLSKMDQDDSSVVYVAQNCYQKNDIDTMKNSIVSAAQKLQEAVTKYEDAKKKALEAATRK